jgi:uncharacterized membrane protein YhaH (DUF805 family)
MHGSNERAVAEMEKSPKRLNRPSFWKWAIPLVLGLVVLKISPVGRVEPVLIDFIVVSAKALVRLVLIVLLAMALARRFRDIGWPAWIGPTILLVTMLGLPFLVVGYASMTYDEHIFEWVSMVHLISDSVNIVLLIVVGSMPGKTARAENIEVARVFD